MGFYDNVHKQLSAYRNAMLRPVSVHDVRKYVFDTHADVVKRSESVC